MRLLIRSGRVIDPARGVDRAADVLIDEGRIAAVEPGIAPSGATVVDAHDLIVAPGLVDMHVHLRDPGQTHKEDIASGTAAAARGGFTAVACMPNTNPPIDHPTVVEYVLRRAERTGRCRVFPIAAITKGRAGDELAPIVGLAASGAVAFSDDGAAVASAGLLRRAMSYATMDDLPIIEHCEDPALSNGGVMHEGTWSTILGLRGLPAASEEVIVARDVLLAEATGARLHIAHVSTAGSVRMIREAKRRGISVTAEVTPHHLVLTDEAMQGFDGNLKMNPPLRGPDDVAALREGLADGTIDVIATDHAPHAPEEKMVEFDAAPFGVVGLETALGVVWTVLVASGLLSPAEVITKMALDPARILRLPAGRLAVDGPADIVIIDPHRRWTVDPEAFSSKSRNTPFAGWTLTCKPVMTIVGGRVTHDALTVEALT